MSGFDRSLLERKERDELSQIAEQLGQKPPSRAKKADIIDLILRLAGVPVGAGGEHAAPASPRQRSRATGNGAAPDDEATAGDGNRREDETRATVASGEVGVGGSDVDVNGSDGEPARTSAVDDPGGASETRERSGTGVGGEGEDPAEVDRSEADRSPATDGQARERGDGSDRADGTPSGQGGGQDQGHRGDEGEPGNRRRRRRGRDRPGGGQQQQAGDDAFGEPIDVEGLLDLRDEGYGFLRLKGYLPSKEDVYVSVKQVRQFALRKGDRLAGKSRAAARNEKNPALLQIDLVNGVDPEKARNRPRFEDLTPLFPDERLNLELPDDPGNMTARIIDLLAPIGKGQRGLIVSPPKAGKTTVMKQIARSIETNNPECHLIVLLVDERPEEVTDMRRWLIRGEVAASTFDRPSDEHTTVAELVIDRAKRMVEDGKDVVIILDGITRLARAYNLAAPATGRIMSGGIDAGALYPPKKFFGAARNVEEGGSLTILATALVETNSRMDEHIFEEFKGTGNMELKLDRRLADRRIYPAIDVEASSTRHEELLFERKQLQQVWKLRRVLSGLRGDDRDSNAAGLELLIDRMRTFKSNEAFLTEIAKAPTVAS
jgi:transcription termination factor Rho